MTNSIDSIDAVSTSRWRGTDMGQVAKVANLCIGWNILLLQH